MTRPNTTRDALTRARAEMSAAGPPEAPPGRAVTKADKGLILDALREAWFRNPDLRLGQLILNATGSAYYVEDEALAAALRAYRPR